MSPALDSDAPNENTVPMKPKVGTTQAMKRTNYFQSDEGGSKPYISFKVASREVADLPAPKPFVLQSALSDFYTQYQLNAAIARPQDRPFVLSRLHAQIQDAFNEFGVQIMSPNFEAQPDAKVWVPRERWHEAPAEKTQGLPG